MFESLGIPISGVSASYVHGFLYVQMRSPFGGRVPRWVPPSSVLRRLFALSSLGRRCEATARQAMVERPWQEALRAWPTRAKQLIETNRRWQSFDLSRADEAALMAHINGLYTHCQEGFIEHFRLHGVDLVPIGMLLSQGAKWGIPSEVIFGTLAGASGETASPQRALDRIAARVADTGTDEFATSQSVSIDEIRRTDRDTAAQIDSFLDRYGSTVVEGYDIDGRTLAEIPNLVVGRILDPIRRAAEKQSEEPTPADLSDFGLTQQQQARFHELVREARRAVAVREEQGPLTIQWPVGLLRGALLEVGRRRVASGTWQDACLALELRVEELAALGSGNDPDNADLMRRRSKRAAQRRMVPPPTLGSSVAIEPKAEWFTPAVAHMVDLLLVTTAELGIMNTHEPPSSRVVSGVAAEDCVETDGASCRKPPSSNASRLLSGSGIGTAVVTGIARVATSDDDAIGYAQPGEILITHATSPAYNLVLGQIGGLVTTTQGAMSHAAVLARELGLTAIVGVANATQVLHTGDQVRLDPGVGTVELLSPAPDS